MGPARPRLPDVPDGTRPAGSRPPPAGKFGDPVPGHSGPAPPRAETPPRRQGWGRRGDLGALRRGLGPRGPGGGDAAGRLAGERSLAARRSAREVARGVAGEQWPGVTPPRLFLALTLGDAKCQVPGVPACPGRGRAGRWSLKGSETRFPRGDGPGVWGGGQEIPLLEGGVCGPGGPPSVHPCTYLALPLHPFRTLAPGGGLRDSCSHQSRHQPEVPEPPPLCRPRGRLGHALQRPLRV